MIFAVFSKFSFGLSCVDNILPASSLMAVRNSCDAVFTAGCSSLASVAAKSTILSFFGRIKLTAPLGISIPNLNIYVNSYG